MVTDQMAVFIPKRLGETVVDWATFMVNRTVKILAEMPQGVLLIPPTITLDDEGTITFGWELRLPYTSIVDVHVHKDGKVVCNSIIGRQGFRSITGKLDGHNLPHEVHRVLEHLVPGGRREDA